jgi:hypothetical protein
MVAAANTGEGASTDTPDVEGFSVAYNDLEAVAKGFTGSPIDVLDKARGQVSAAKLQPGAFGPSDQANGIVRYWNEALDQRYAEIGTCMNVIADMADNLQHVLENYLATEEKNKDSVDDAKKDQGQELNKAPKEGYHEDPGAARPEIR